MPNKTANDINGGTYIVNTYTRKTGARNGYIGSICAINTRIGGTSIKGSYIKSTYIGNICTKSIFIKNVKPKTWAKSRIILARLEVNNYYF